MTQPGKSEYASNESSKELLAKSVLLHCRTVVEKANFVTTGVMTNVEGELFEVELHEFELFELGEVVKLTVYSPAGMQSIQAIVFAKYEGAIALLQPPSSGNQFAERREHTRVEVAGKAQIVSVLNNEGEEQKLAEPFQLKIHDISLSGLSFSGPAAAYFTQNMKLKAEVDIGFSFRCELVIVRREKLQNLLVCGAKMQIVEQEMMRPLRALILRQQVEMHAKVRRESGSRRS